jgi:spore coat polysaccharide biosynthesis predicted glycosyltransferase SpsG
MESSAGSKIFENIIIKIPKVVLATEYKTVKSDGFNLTKAVKYGKDVFW